MSELSEIYRQLRLLNITIDELNLNQREIQIQTDINLSLFYVENLRDELLELSMSVGERHE